MGVEDRDYYRERSRDDKPFSSPSAQTRTLKDWLYIAIFWIVLLLVLVKAAKYLFPEEWARLKHLEVRSMPVELLKQLQPELAPQMRVAPPVPVQAQPISPRTDGPQFPDARTSPPPTQAVSATTTIYLCKAYTGGLFWSSAHCNTQRALIDRTATVPGSLPFDQQVQLAEAQRREAERLYNQQPAPAVQAASRCMVLKAERESIDARYANWKWQPPEVINPDQIRMRALREEQTRLGCAER